jgi:mono/diheme cytochrome c family protein
VKSGRRPRNAVEVSLFVTWLAMAMACGGSGSEKAAPQGPVISEPARAEAKQIFSTRCFACHGADGRGDGPAGASLVPRPANFHDGSWQNAVNDQHIEQIIQFGGAAVGKSPTMPGNPDLTGKPEVVAALREHIRGLAN